MIFSVFWENPAVVGLILAIPATTLGYLAYRKSLPIDKATAKSAADTGHLGLIAALQADNQDLRAEIRSMRTDYSALREGVELCQQRIDVVEMENARLERELAKINGSSGH